VNQPDLIIPWSLPGWMEEAREWIAGRLEALGLEFTGKIDQPHVRPWSTILRAETKTGMVFFKAGIPALAHEPGLMALLSRWRPDCILVPLAIDLERGWMLMPDGGHTLRARLQEGDKSVSWDQVLPLYAGLQQYTASRLPELLGAGAFDRRLVTLPGLLDALVTDLPLLCIGLEDGLSTAQYEELTRLGPVAGQMCSRLAELPIPETLHHDDFHDGNIFVRDGRYLLFDWAESCAAHPFFTLVVGLRSIAYRMGVEEDNPKIARLRDLYLDYWRGYASPEVLAEALALALPLGMLCRALTWHRVLSSIPEEARAGNIDAVPGWLQGFLETARSFYSG